MPAEPRRYTQEEIDNLIGCAKVTIDPPKRDLKLDRGHYRNDMRLRSADGKLEFRAFMRRNADLPENFSIGLVYLPKDGTAEVVLLRCNGPHGGYNDSFDPEHAHWDFHVHRASVDMIETGQKPEKVAVVNRDFASYEEALLYFLRTTNVTDAQSYFTDVVQGRLPFVEEESAR
ncbi:MAG: hypothetical protein ACM3S5_01225 [Rhodospirillales bacterium]